MVRPIYTVTRAVTLPLASILLILYSIQVYRDRKALTDRSRPNAHRVFRWAGFVGTINLLVICVDFFGVYGLLPAAVRIVIGTIITLSWWTALCVAVYHSTIATLILLPIENRDRKSNLLRRAITVICAVASAWIVAALASDAHWVVLVFLTCNVLGLSFIIGVTNFVFFTVRRHYNNVQALDIHVHSSGAESLENLVKTWRLYSIFITVSLGALTISLVASLVSELIGLASTDPDSGDSSGGGLASFFADSDPNEVPNSARFLAVAVTFCVLGVMLWRSWRPATVGSPTNTKASSAKTSTDRRRTTRLSITEKSTNMKSADPASISALIKANDGGNANSGGGHLELAETRKMDNVNGEQSQSRSVHSASNSSEPTDTNTPYASHTDRDSPQLQAHNRNINGESVAARNSKHSRAQHHIDFSRAHRSQVPNRESNAVAV